MNDRCVAHSSQTGNRCKNRPIRGAAVCRSHGGAAGQVRQKAAERIAALVDPAITRLGHLLNDPTPGIAMAAVKDILDRAGYGARQKYEVDIHARAAELAQELGLDARELIAEAERLVRREAADQ